jgi:SagB-type dehydrogenase family enzyme
VKLVARNPDLHVCWSRGRLLVRDLVTGRTVHASAQVVPLLHLFGRARTAEGAAGRLPGYEPRAVLRGIRELVRLGLLLPAETVRGRRSRLAAWKGNLASAYYHAACRDLRFAQGLAAIEEFLRERVAPQRRPPGFKRYGSRPGRPLPESEPPSPDATGLDRVLARRRTVREFSRRPVSLEDLAAVVRGTWGRTGWLTDRVLGRFATKTSPSAGALHPIECYVLAWNVRGLRAGTYHYDVAGDELRRLRSGSPRESAVRAASGQRWVGGAAFLCVMTAVFPRTLWKYGFEGAYRTLWLDAGHLGQTFSLLATARGLGPFTTAAFQDTHLERHLGLDGGREFPVYLCGAGLPATRRRQLPFSEKA